MAPPPIHALRRRAGLRACLVAVAGVSMAAASASTASQQSDMRELREMVLELQDQVRAQQQQLDDQRGVIREAGLEDQRGSSSGLSSFLESTDFSGWVAASYFYNVNDPNRSNPQPNSPLSNPFHPDHNTFQLDEVWFAMKRPPTRESPAGFEVVLVYGATAGAVTKGNVDRNEIWVARANVGYRTPWGPTLTAGKFATPIGYEVAGAARNVNITRGFLYNLAQPISHVGATVSQEFDSGLTYSFGIVNGFDEEQPDSNQNKGFLWQLGWGSDVVTLLFNGFYAEKSEDFLKRNATGAIGPAGSFDDHYLLDVVVEWTPADDLLFWANFDYATVDEGSGDPWITGVAIGGRVGVTDRLGVAGRFEFAKVEHDRAGGDDDNNLWSVTGTTDFALTNDLTWKLEAKWETVGGSRNDLYADGGGVDDSALYLGSQVYYEF